MTNRRCLMPKHFQWNEQSDVAFDTVCSAFTSIAQHAQRYRRNNPDGVVIQQWNPMLTHYKFGQADPWARTGEGSWWLLFGDPKNPLSPDALLRFFVMKNAEAGVDLLWTPRADGREGPVGPINASDAMGRWLPANGEEGWTSPVGVWEETAGLTYPEMAALALVKCLDNPSYAELINGGFYLDDMPGLNNPWGTWESAAGGLPRYGDGGPFATYHSPIVKGTEAFFEKLRELGALDRFEYRINAYGNSPSRGNLGQWIKDPVGGKCESFLAQGGMPMPDENEPGHMDFYLGPTFNNDPNWPGWWYGYRWMDQQIGTAKSIVQIGRLGAGDPAHWRRWALGAALLYDASIVMNRSWSDYDIPSAHECPEYWSWTENVATSLPERRTLRSSGRVLWLRAYRGERPHHKKLLVVNPHRTLETGGIPPEDARMLDLWTMGISEFFTWNNLLEGLEVRSLIKSLE